MCCWGRGCERGAPVYFLSCKYIKGHCPHPIKRGRHINSNSHIVDGLDFYISPTSLLPDSYTDNSSYSYQGGLVFSTISIPRIASAHAYPEPCCS